tara:strand:+ start:7 stop:348 length:342 start_codon:yes stop_codon:yes gene_type:complete
MAVKRYAPKPIPNGQTSLTSEDWDLLINSPTNFPYEIFDDKKADIDNIRENLFEEYLELLKAGELLPNTSFEMFEQNYSDFDTDFISKIKKRIRDRNRLEGIASLVLRSRGLV